MVDAVVLGSGVVGLTIARELTDRGYKVVVVARDLADDLTSSGFASPWAGCNWYSFAHGAEEEAAQWDMITYKALGPLAEEHPELCRRTRFWTVWDKPKREEEAVPYYHAMDGVEYQAVESTPDSPLPGHKKYGFTTQSYLINAPAYIAHLASTLRARGVQLLRRTLSSIDEAFTLDLPDVGQVGLVVNATGLGAQALIGVEDAEMHPARGQTVLVRAPWVKECFMHVEGFYPEPLAPGEKAPPEPAYIIPRPGPDGHVILGGTYIVDNYSTLPHLPTAERILKDCHALCPMLTGPDPGPGPGPETNGKSWRDIEVISHQVGLRPARHGGARLELERRVIGGGAGGGTKDLAPRSGRVGEKREVVVVHAYGTGSAGFQNSIGLAVKASDLVDQYFGKRMTTPAPSSPVAESAAQLAAVSI